MPTLAHLRLAAREVCNQTLSAVDRGAASRSAVPCDGARLVLKGIEIDIEKRLIYFLGIGKAATVAARAIHEILGTRLTAGLVIGPSVIPREGKSVWRPSGAWQHYQGGHPLPNEDSLAAGDA